MDLHLVIARKALGRLTAGDLVAWAVGALVEGLDSPSLRRLAGLDAEADVRFPDALALFDAALRELGIVPPDNAAAVRAYVAGLAREIVDGRAAPQQQVERIHSEVVTPLNHPKDLMVWCYVSDGLRPREWSLDADAMQSFEEIPDAELDAAIRDLAEWYLAAILPRSA